MITPPLLTKNNQAVIVAPSGGLPKGSLDTARQALTHWGLTTTLHPDVYAQHSVFAGTDTQRSNALQEALTHPEVQLILAARGGYGLTRYVDELQFIALLKHPKWIVGYSDVTALHLAAHKAGVLTIHGPMGTSFGRAGSTASIKALHTLLFTGKAAPIVQQAAHINPGKATAPLVGGNLSLVCDSLGTATELDTRGKILVLEDIGDYYYRIDRMLTQLNRAGKLRELKGLVLGSFSNLLQGKPAFKEQVMDMVKRLCAPYPYPIAIHMPIGHEPTNFPFVHGATYQLVVTKQHAELNLVTSLC